MNAIQLEAVVKRFGDAYAVNKVSLEVAEGEVLGLLGPNGAGKTTLINILIGLLKADSGTAMVFGQNLRNASSEARRAVGIVPQELAVYEDLTAMENVRFFASLYGLGGKTLAAGARSALEMAGLTDQANVPPRRFSGGMKRRLNIACAVAHDPRLVIMDEPTVGIDPQSRRHILQAVKAMAAQGRTVIYTSHYMEEVQEIAGRVVIMDHGKVIASGTHDELVGMVTGTNLLTIGLRHPALADTQALLAIPGIHRVDLEEGVLRVVSSRDSFPLEKVIASLSSTGAAIHAIESRTPDLETVFLTLTGRSLRE